MRIYLYRDLTNGTIEASFLSPARNVGEPWARSRLGRMYENYYFANGSTDNKR